MGSNTVTTGEYYRIQNVEFATFLEVSKVYDGATVVLRHEKSYAEKQKVKVTSESVQASIADDKSQWVFAPGTAKDTYKIKSVPSVGEPPELYLFADTQGMIVTGEETEATEWYVGFEKNGDECR